MRAAVKDLYLFRGAGSGGRDAGNLTQIESIFFAYTSEQPVTHKNPAILSCSGYYYKPGDANRPGSGSFAVFS
jgi:hypothetical protein